MDIDTKEAKNQQLQKQMLKLDQSKYQAELKAKQTLDQVRRVEEAASKSGQYLAGSKGGVETKLQKSQMDLKKAQMQIEKLQEQLRLALGKHSKAQPQVTQS